MAAGSTSITFSASSYLQGRLDISWEDYNISGNYTPVRVSLYAHRTNNYETTGKSWSGNITIDGTASSFSEMSSSVTLGSSWKLMHSYSKNVYHNNDGTKSLSVSGWIKGPSGTALAGKTSSGSTSITLPTIPRTSSFSANNAEIEGNCAISINRASSSFTHRLEYKFGSLSGTITTNAGTNYNWTIPSSFYGQIPNSKTGTCTLTCHTYNGGTLIGTTSRSITISCNESKCKPSISATMADINETIKKLTGDTNKIVKGYSDVQITPKATVKNSASISKITVNGQNASNNNPITFYKSTTDTFSVSITDSRGYSNSYTVKGTLINYIPLTCNANFYRPFQTGNEVKFDFSGNYFNSSFGVADNNLVIKYKQRLKGTTEWSEEKIVEPNIIGNTYNGSVSCGSDFDYRSEYEFSLTFNDILISTTKIINLSKGQGDFEIFDGALRMNGFVLFYDDEKFIQNDDGSFSKF